MKTIIACVTVNKKELQQFFTLFSSKRTLPKNNRVLFNANVSLDMKDNFFKAIYYKNGNGNEIVEFISTAEFISSDYHNQKKYDCETNLTLFKEIVSHNEIEKIKYKNKWFKHKITNCVFYIPFSIIDESDIIDQIPERSERSLKETDKEFYDNLIPITLEEIYNHIKNSSLTPFYYKFSSFEEKDNVINYLCVENNFKIGEIKYDDEFFLIKDGRIYGLTTYEIIENIPIIDSISVLSNIIEISPYDHSNYMIQEIENKKYEFFKGNLDMIFNIENIRNPTIKEMIEYSDLPF